MTAAGVWFDGTLVTTEREPEPKREPCPEGFHWMGQSYAVCDVCGLPAWDHAGMATLRPEAGGLGFPGGPSPWQLRPWRGDEAARVRANWDPDLPVWRCPTTRSAWKREVGEAAPRCSIKGHEHRLTAGTRGLG